VSEQPDALRLADLIQSRYGNDINDEAAAELRRQHEVIAELLEALEDLLQEYDVQMSAYQEMDVQRSARAAIAKAEGVKS
jgi:hypothetical protein